MRLYDPELKKQSAEWHTPSSSRPAKFRRLKSKLKMLMIFAYDIRDVFITHKVPAGNRSMVNTNRCILKNTPD